MVVDLASSEKHLSLLCDLSPSLSSLNSLTVDDRSSSLQVLNYADCIPCRRVRAPSHIKKK